MKETPINPIEYCLTVADSNFKAIDGCLCGIQNARDKIKGLYDKRLRELDALTMERNSTTDDPKFAEYKDCLVSIAHVLKRAETAVQDCIDIKKTAARIVKVMRHAYAYAYTHQKKRTLAFRMYIFKLCSQALLRQAESSRRKIGDLHCFAKDRLDPIDEITE